MVKDGNSPITMPSKVTIKRQIPHDTMKATPSNSPVPSRMTIVPRRRKRAPHDLPKDSINSVTSASNPTRRQMSLMRDP